MDDATEHKIRDLKLRILRVEKELAKTVHNANLGSWLRAGHPGQIAKAGERDRKRLEDKLAELRAQLESLTPDPTAKSLKAVEEATLPQTEALPPAVPPSTKEQSAPEKKKPAAEIKSEPAKTKKKTPVKKAPAAQAKPAAKSEKKAADKKTAAVKNSKAKTRK